MRRREKLDILIMVGILVLTLVFLCGALQMLFYLFRPQQQEQQPAQTKTVTHDGVDYFPRQDIEVFLVAGTDSEGPVDDSGTYFNPGEADSVFLLIFDQTAEEVRVLNLNRDSMVYMPALGEGNRRIGTYYGQLALSHAYGSGLEDSCENLRTTVSGMLNGIAIDHYVVVNMDAVALVNDAVGGVTVTVTDDFSKVTDELPMGEVTLRGDQALDYVRIRRGVGDQLNVSRMERQKAFMEGFLKSLQMKLETSTSFPLEVYDAVSPYMVTDCSGTVFSAVVERYGGYRLAEIVSPAGENVRGEKFMEFHLDQEALLELVLRLFYAPK